jgi:hypothetical protein
MTILPTAACLYIYIYILRSCVVLATVVLNLFGPTGGVY